MRRPDRLPRVRPAPLGGTRALDAHHRAVRPDAPRRRDRARARDRDRPLHPRADHRHRPGAHRRARGSSSTCGRTRAIRWPGARRSSSSARRSVNDRTADRRTLESQRRGNTERLLLLEQQYRGARRADSAEARRLQSRATYLERLIKSKTRRLAVMQEIADSSVAGAQRGALGTVEVQRLELDARSLGEEVETATNDLAETRADIARLDAGGRHAPAGVPAGARARSRRRWSATPSAHPRSAATP